MGDVPPDQLKTMAMATEPAAYSAGNLKELLPNNKMRYIRKPLFWELIGFNCGIDGGQIIPQDMCCMDRMCKRLKEVSQENGRPGRDRVLPVAWQREGVHEVFAVDGSLWIKLRNDTWKNTTVRLDSDLSPVGDAGFIQIGNNYSMRKATVINTATAASADVMMVATCPRVCKPVLVHFSPKAMFPPPPPSTQGSRVNGQKTLIRGCGHQAGSPSPSLFIHEG